MYTKAVVAAALTRLAAVAPTPSAGQFTGISLQSVSPVHVLSINANGQHFLNKPTTTYCPEGTDGLDCSTTQKDITVFSGLENTPASPRFAEIVPGGQQISVEQDVALGFTIAHSASIPQGATQGGFTYAPAASSGTVGSLTWKGKGFSACSKPDQGANLYQIYANVDGLNQPDCYGINFGTSAYNGSVAWQYV